MGRCRRSIATTSATTLIDRHDHASPGRRGGGPPADLGLQPLRESEPQRDWQRAALGERNPLRLELARRRASPRRRRRRRRWSGPCTPFAAATRCRRSRGPGAPASPSSRPGTGRHTLAAHRPEHPAGRLDPDRGRDPGATPLPTAAPTVAPTPPPTGCRAGNRVAAGSQQTFTTVPNAGHAVALTLDMGGRLDPGIDILNLLIANHVCATLFPTGAMAQTTQGQQVMAVIKAHPSCSRSAITPCTTATWSSVRRIADDRTVRRRDADRGLHPQGADRRGGDPGAVLRPAAGALLARTVRIGEPGGARRGGIGRLHQDLHVGRRHDRLEADRRRRPHCPADRHQGRRQRG